MHDLREGFDPLFFFLDIDECFTNSHSCDVNAMCSNNVGSYACACKAGFTGDGYTCTGEPFNSNRGTQREYSPKPHKHSIVERTLVFKR